MEDKLKNANIDGSTVIDKISNLLYNYDLALAWAKGEVAIREATMELCKHKKSRYYQNKFIEAKVDKERFEIFIDDIIVKKNEILDNLSLLLSKYKDSYKKVFILYFIHHKSRKEVADQTGFCQDAVKKITERLRKDLITLYIP